MEVYIKVREDGFIEFLTEQDYGFDGYVPVEVSDDFDVMMIGDYRFIDGELIYTGEGTAAKEKAEIQVQIDELKAKLTNTDYVITKMTEYNVSGTPMPEDDAERYASIIEQRVQWRVQINELEAQLNA